MALEQQQCQAGRTAGPTYPAAVCSHGPAHRACGLVGTGQPRELGGVDVAEKGLAVSSSVLPERDPPERSLREREAERRGAGGRRSAGRPQYWESPASPSPWR